MIGCITRVRIVDDIEGHARIVETDRERSAVYFDLVKLVHQTNHTPRTEFRASLHLAEDLITIHFYTTCVSEVGVKFNAEIFAIGKPLHVCEQIIWGQKGGVA
jgi:hypothetical protein